ncbi:hypothetical protein ACFL35_00015 [Candidatus Riflebacteria bacterium]
MVKLNKILCLILSIALLLSWHQPISAAGDKKNVAKSGKKMSLSIRSIFLLSAATGSGALVSSPFVAFTISNCGLGWVIGGIAATIPGIFTGAANLITAAGATVWAGFASASGMVVGSLGAIGAATGGAFTGISGFTAQLCGSRTLVPDFIVLGIAVLTYYLWGKRQKKTTIQPMTAEQRVKNRGVLSLQVIDYLAKAAKIKKTVKQKVLLPEETKEAAGFDEEEIAPDINEDDVDNYTLAHQKYIKAYNSYIRIVSGIGKSEELKEKMKSEKCQKILKDYEASYRRWQKAKSLKK